MNMDFLDGYEDEPIIVTCPDCGKQAYAVMVDDGIGETEYWGSVSVHHDWHLVTHCCQAEVDEPKKGA